MRNMIKINCVKFQDIYMISGKMLLKVFVKDYSTYIRAYVQRKFSSMNHRPRSADTTVVQPLSKYYPRDWCPFQDLPKSNPLSKSRSFNCCTAVASAESRISTGCRCKLRPSRIERRKYFGKIKPTNFNFLACNQRWISPNR